MYEKKYYCLLCSTDKEQIKLRKVVVHRPYKTKDIFYKCYKCGSTFAGNDLETPLKIEVNK